MGQTYQQRKDRLRIQSCEGKRIHIVAFIVEKAVLVSITCLCRQIVATWPISNIFFAEGDILFVQIYLWSGSRKSYCHQFGTTPLQQ